MFEGHRRWFCCPRRPQGRVVDGRPDPNVLARTGSVLAYHLQQVVRARSDDCFERLQSPVDSASTPSGQAGTPREGIAVATHDGEFVVAGVANSKGKWRLGGRKAVPEEGFGKLPSLGSWAKTNNQQPHRPATIPRQPPRKYFLPASTSTSSSSLLFFKLSLATRNLFHRQPPFPSGQKEPTPPRWRTTS